MGTDTEFCQSAVRIGGQARYLAGADGLVRGRTRLKHRSGGWGRLQHPDMGTDTMSDILVRNVQRETFNSQLSTG